MSYKIALNFEDGVTRFIESNPGETVADAAYRQGINIPLDCRDGACGTCKSFCESGRYDGGSYIEDALTDEEAEEGYCLTCQMKPETDLVLRIDASSEVCKTQVTDFQAEVLGIEQLSDSTISLSLKVEDASRLHFLPGQYVKILVPGEQDSRSYSFSSPPGSDVATFLIRNVPGGLMSGYLTERAKPGDKLTLKGPLGSFYLRDTKRPVLMLAGGTGLAPFLSMLGKVAETGCEQPIHLVYGVTNDGDLVEVETIAEYAKQDPELHFRHLRRRQGQQPSAQGLRHPSSGGQAPERRRRGRLSLRSAADGRGGAGLLPGPGRQPGELPLREVHAE